MAQTPATHPIPGCLFRYQRFGVCGRVRSGFSLLELVLSIGLFAILVITIHQNLTMTLIAADSAGARMRCLVTANNLLEQAQATPGTFTNVLLDLVAGTATRTWYPVPASYSAGGMVGSVTTLISSTTIWLATDTAGIASVATSVAIIFVKEGMHQNEVNLQAFRSPLE